MQGQKIKMVKKTLNLLLTFLKEKDRLCLICFDNAAERMTPLIKCSEANKANFTKVIQKIRAGGGTTIGAATQMAFA